MKRSSYTIFSNLEKLEAPSKLNWQSQQSLPFEFVVFCLMIWKKLELFIAIWNL